MTTKLCGNDGTGFTTPTTALDMGNSGGALANNAAYAATAGTMTTAHVTTSTGGTASHCKVHVYDNAGNLVASSGVITIANGDCTAAISGTLSAASYSIVVSVESGYMYTQYDSGSSAFHGRQWASANFNYTTPPATLPASGGSNCHEFTVWIEGTPSGGGGGGHNGMLMGVG